MQEKTAESLLESNLLVAILGYSFLMMGVQGKSDDEIAALIKKWQVESALTIISTLNKNGFSIVKKEPALENFPPIT